MSDIKKYSEIYNQIMQLQQDDIKQLISDAGSKGEKEFYETIDAFLQRQRQDEYEMLSVVADILDNNRLIFFPAYRKCLIRRDRRI